MDKEGSRGTATNNRYHNVETKTNHAQTTHRGFIFNRHGVIGNNHLYVNVVKNNFRDQER